MEEKEVKERAEKEYKRLRDILKNADISERRMKALDPVIQNTAWMKVKLDDARAAIKTAQIAIAYDNGGGQRGIRENPLFKGYESLWKSYMLGMTKILDTLPAEVVIGQIETPERPQTVLELVRSKRKNA